MAGLTEDMKLAIKITATDTTKQAFGSLHQSLNGLKNAAIAVGAAVASALALRDVIDTTMRVSQEINLLTDNFGMSAEQASKFNFALKVVGSSADEFTVAVGFLNKKMIDSLPLVQQGTDDFSKWGITILKANGDLRDTGDVLADMRAKMQQAGAGQAAMGIGADLMGRSSRNLTEFLQLTDAEMAQLGKDAEEMGQVFTDAGVKDMKEFTRQMNKAQIGLEGVKLGIARELLPILRSLLLWLRQNAGGIKSFVESLRGALGMLKDVTQWAGHLWDTMKGWLGTIGATKLATDLLVIALATIAGGPVVGAVAAVAIAFGEVKDTVKLIADNWENLRAAVHNGRLAAKDGPIEALLVLMVKVGDAFEAVGTAAAGLKQSIVEIATGIGSTLGNAVQDAFSAIDFDIGPFHMHKGKFTFDGLNFGPVSIPAFTTGPSVPGIVGGIVGGLGPTPIGLGLSGVGFKAAAELGATIQNGIQYLNGIPIAPYGGAHQMAEGGAGIATRPTLFMAGERGPESFAFGRAAGGGPNITVNVSGNVTRSERELAEIVAGEIVRRMRGTGQSMGSPTSLGNFY